MSSVVTRKEYAVMSPRPPWRGPDFPFPPSGKVLASGWGAAREGGRRDPILSCLVLEAGAEACVWGSRLDARGRQQLCACGSVSEAPPTAAQPHVVRNRGAHRAL